MYRYSTAVQKVDLALELSKLPSAEGAAYDSFRDQHDAQCHPDTRIELLRDIRLWADDERGKCIFWLSGMAGTEKSTIPRTVAQHRSYTQAVCLVVAYIDVSRFILGTKHLQ